MSSIGYISYVHYLSYVVNSTRAKRIMIEIHIDELLKNHDRSFYWLAKDTGISHTTLWRVEKGKGRGINCETLEKLCETLKCQPGDVLSHTTRKKPRTRPAPKKLSA